MFGLSFQEVPDNGWEKKTDEKEESNPDSEKIAEEERAQEQEIACQIS